MNATIVTKKNTLENKRQIMKLVYKTILIQICNFGQQKINDHVASRKH